jgi:transposase
MQYYMNEMFRHFNQYRIILCMDNAAWHKAEEINMPDNMISWFLPPYSPELNPVEILWKHIRANYLITEHLNSWMR